MDQAKESQGEKTELRASIPIGRATLTEPRRPNKREPRPEDRSERTIPSGSSQVGERKVVWIVLVNDGLRAEMTDQ